MKKILIIGSSSFIGLPIVQRLSQNKKWKVSGTYQDHNPLEDLVLQKVSLQKLDMLSKRELQSCLQLAAPDVIVHCAAMSNVDECEKNPQQCFLHNVSPVQTIVDYCKFNPEVKYIFFSSSEVFDGKKGKPYTEKDRCSSLNTYGKYKTEAEGLVGSLQNKAIIRPCLVFGIPKEYQHRNIFNYIYKTLKEGKTFTAYQDMIRTPTYVNDIPAMVESIIMKDKTGIFHTGGRATSISGFAKEVADHFGFPEELIISKKSNGNEVAYKPIDNRLDCTYTKKELDILFRSLAEALPELSSEIKRSEARGAA